MHVFREASVGRLGRKVGSAGGWTRDVCHVRLILLWAEPQRVGGQKGSVPTREWCLGCDANVSVGVLPHSVR